MSQFSKGMKGKAIDLQMVGSSNQTCWDIRRGCIAVIQCDVMCHKTAQVSQKFSTGDVVAVVWAPWKATTKTGHVLKLQKYFSFKISKMKHLPICTSDF